MFIKGTFFSGFRYMKGVGISQAELYERVGKSVRGPTGLRDAYLAVRRSTKRSGL